MILAPKSFLVDIRLRRMYERLKRLSIVPISNGNNISAKVLSYFSRSFGSESRKSTRRSQWKEHLEKQE